MNYIAGLIKTEFDVVSNFRFNSFCRSDLIGCTAFLKSPVPLCFYYAGISSIGSTAVCGSANISSILVFLSMAHIPFTKLPKRMFNVG